jgi:hypothetical protein
LKRGNEFSFLTVYPVPLSPVVAHVCATPPQGFVKTGPPVSSLPILHTAQIGCGADCCDFTLAPQLLVWNSFASQRKL